MRPLASTSRRNGRVSSSLPNEAYASATRARRNARERGDPRERAAESRARTAGIHRVPASQDLPP